MCTINWVCINVMFYIIIYVTQIMLQGTTLPPTQCDAATISFFNASDECTRAVASLFGGNENAIVNLYDGDCPMRFNNYVMVCSDAYGDEVNNIILYSV